MLTAPENVDVGLLGVATVPPAPETMLQAPEPVAGVLPASVTEVAQTVWSGPALAPEGLATNAINTSSVDAAQGAFEIVHLNV